MLNDTKKLLDELDTLLATLEKLPKGSLVTHKRKNDHCYYGHQFKDPDTKKRRELYIPLDEYPYWRAIFDQRNMTKQRVREIRALVKKHKKEVTLLRNEQHEARLEAEQKKQQATLAGTAHMPENQTYFTLAEEFVRSGSELALANRLYINGVNYVYEQRLYTPLGLLLPDFTVIAGGRLIYIEHLGLMDQEEYRKNWEEKLRKYESAGIREGLNLICTYESSRGFMNFDEIDCQLRQYAIIK